VASSSRSGWLKAVQVDSGKSGREASKARLNEEKRRIYEEIRNYPRPVPVCDQHFNYLLEERDRICRELNRLEKEGALEPHSSQEPIDP
jgi:hypothetical protein